MPASSPIKRHGGKGYLAAKIRALFPPHTRYCEPFFGSGAVLFSCDGEGVAEFVNDVDRQLLEFWLVLRDTPQRMLQALWATPFSPELFDEAVSNLHSSDRVKRATAFFIRNRQSRQALGKDFATPTSRLRRGMNEQVSAWLSAIDGLPEFHARLRRVEIRYMDAVDFIRELDSPEAMFYCDPPYMPETRAKGANEYGEYEMTVAQHERLLETLAGIEGKFVLSGYPSQLYNAAAAGAGWRHVDFVIDNKASSSKSKEKKVERCWMNFDG